MQKFTASRPDVHTAIYFDGAHANAIRLSPNVAVRYSGGAGTGATYVPVDVFAVIAADLRCL